MHAVVQAKPLAQALKRLASLMNGRKRRFARCFTDVVWITARDGTLRLEAEGNFGAVGAVLLPEAEIRAEGWAGLPLRQFSRVAALLEAEVEIRLESEECSLCCGDFICQIGTVDKSLRQAASFDFTPLAQAEIPVATLRDWLARILSFVSQSDTMEGMSCLFVSGQENGTLHICGLNGHQFAKVEAPLPEMAAMLLAHGPMLLTRAALKLLDAGWLAGVTVRLEISKKEARFTCGDGSLTLSRSMYTYPNYQVFAQKALDGPHTVEVDRLRFLHALRRLSLFTTGNNRCVYLRFRQTHIECFVLGSDYPKPQATVLLPHGQSDCPALVRAFPADDLLTILGHFKSETVTLRLPDKAGEKGPHQITGQNADQGYQVIIMPMEIMEEIRFAQEAA